MIGIYALWFEEPSMIYVGQSQHIKDRYREHCSKLKRSKHTNYKVQDCYRQYGVPELVVLEYCTAKELNDKEIEWTAEFNSIKEGLNIIEAGQVGYGPNSNSSKYSKRQILKVFSLLYRTDKPFSEVSTLAKVPKHLIIDIAKGASHLWLRDTYPDKYSAILSRSKYAGNSYKGTLVEFISPDGSIYEVSDIAKFTRTLNVKDSEQFRKGLSKLRAGILKSYLGWKIYK